MILNICDKHKTHTCPLRARLAQIEVSRMVGCEVHGGAQLISAESARKVRLSTYPAQSRIAAAGLTREARIAGKNPPSNPITEAKARDEIKIFGVGAKRKTTSEKL